MIDFEFFSPTRFVFGRGSERKTGELVRRAGGTKVLLHFGGGSVKANGVYDKVVASLEAAGVPYVALGGVRPNPRSGLVREGIALCRREKVDFVLAVGGGSVIDSAKAIAFGTLYAGDFEDFYFGKDVKTPRQVTSALPIGAVLTIAAAGSEGSANSIVNLEPGNRKRGATGEALRPRFAVLNPEFTYTLPPFQTACGAVDIFAHLVERYFTPTEDVLVSDELIEGLMRAVVSAGTRAIADPTDYSARADLMWAGSLAHNNVCGVGRVQDWASHGIEHELSARYDCAHGAGLAVVMPAWMDYVKGADLARFARFAVRVWDVPCGAPAEMADAGIARYRAWVRSLGLPLTFAELGADPADIPQLVASLGLRGNTLGSFRPLDEADVAAILESAAGKPRGGSSVRACVLSAALLFLGALGASGGEAPAFDDADPGSIHVFAETLLVRRDSATAAACRNRLYLALDKLWKLAVCGDLTNRVRYAEARETVGVLYGQTRFLTLARLTRENIRREYGEFPDLRSPTSDPAVLAHRKLVDLNRKDLTEEVEPGDGTHPFWNARAMFFTYAPAFDFTSVPGAAEYRFHVYDRNLSDHPFAAKSPFASLRPVWDAIPAGATRVVCFAVDAGGRILGTAGERRFWRLEPFHPNGSAPARRTYAEALARVNGYLCNWREIRDLVATGRMDLSLQTNVVNYPSKMLPCAIRMLIAHGEIAAARTVADYLLSLREPAGAPLEHFTPTYAGDYFICRRYRGQTMMLYPAEGALGFLDLYAACGDRKYLEAAELTARTYLRLQRPDGTWALKYDLSSGRVCTPNALMPNGVIDFLERLYAATGNAAYRAAADRAFAFIERGPLSDWNWEGQFEDIGPSDSKYVNLTKHFACDTAIYLLKRFPGEAKRLDQARRLLRFAEDQFVVWTNPCDADGQSYDDLPYYPYESWRCPAALEQYRCYQPIDASAAKLIVTYLALYAAEGNPLDLAKARALGDSMVNIQDDNGRIRTYWIPEAGDRDPLAGAVRLPSGGDWFNCMSASAEALARLKAFEEK